MTKPSISLKTNLLNILRLFFKIPLLETILRRLTFGKYEDSFYVKLIPNHYQYAKDSIRNVSINNIKYSLDISDLVDWYVYFGISEKAIFQLIQLIQKKDVVLDVGSNIGNIALKMAVKVENEGVIHAFEPDDFNYNKLSRNLSLNNFQNIRVNHFGLGDELKTVFLKTNDEQNRGMNSVMDFNLESGGTQKIEVKTIDNYVSENKLDRINVIKVDVEGYELNVLKGAIQTLENFKPKLFIELDNSNLTRQNHTASELIKFLDQFNYSITNANTNKPINYNDDFENCHYDIICI